MKPTLILPLAALFVLGCQKPSAPSTTSKQSIPMETYGKLPDGREAKIYTLTNKHGVRAKVTEYGAILVSVEVPDKSGKTADVTLGYDSLAGWLTNTSYFGSTVGRFGNRIANALLEVYDDWNSNGVPRYSRRIRRRIARPICTLRSFIVNASCWRTSSRPAVR